MNYNNQILNDVGVYDVLISKEENIHKELFNNALSKFKEEHKEYSDEKYLFIEYRTSNDYFEQSKIVVIEKIFPYKRQTFDLGESDDLGKLKYWDDYKFNKKYEKIDNEDESLEKIEMLYTSGKALVRNKYTGEEFKIDFKQCGNIPYSEDWFRFRGDLNPKSSVVE